VEGRDEKGIKKTVSALLKILHPDGPPADAEFDECVDYAVECRTRVKEQMNKRKPDDEFARINLSYYKADGTEVVVFCPESRNAVATQQPFRRHLGPETEEVAAPAPVAPAAPPVVAPVQAAPIVESAAAPVGATAGEGFAEAAAAAVPEPAASPELTERHLTIRYNDTGQTYESLFGAYLVGAKRSWSRTPTSACSTRSRTSSGSASCWLGRARCDRSSSSRATKTAARDRDRREALRSIREPARRRHRADARLQPAAPRSRHQARQRLDHQDRPRARHLPEAAELVRAGGQ